jgi:DNA-binding transcriptional LysR family regulator
MKLERLEAFVGIADEGSFTRAARRLGISQPSLTQRIQALEADVGGPLIERLPSSLRLTAAGKALLPEAQAAVRSADRAHAAARHALAIEAGEIEVATLLSLTIGVLPRVIMTWHERHPDVAVRTVEYTHRRLLEEDVANGVGDVAVGPTPAAWHGPVEPIGAEELVIVLPRTDALATGEPISLGQLADRGWILFHTGHGLSDVVTAACRGAGFDPHSAVRTTQVEAAVRLAAAGVGPAMVPDNCVPDGIDAAVVHVDPPILRELAAYTRTDWTPLSSAFLDALRHARRERD